MKSYKTLLVICEFAICLGLSLLLFVAYETWGKVGELTADQAQLDQQLSQSWDGVSSQGESARNSTSPSIASRGPAPGIPAPRAAAEGQTVSNKGEPLVRLYIPILGMHWTVLEGTDLGHLKRGPGHYIGTQKPGEVGNFSVAGHRSVGMFWDLDKVHAGDSVVIEGRSDWYVYRVSSSQIVSPSATEVLAPVPGRPGVVPTESKIVLTTCNPRWDNYERLVVTGDLVRTSSKAQERPIELGGG
ncbi:class E sortase [Amycolatopsis sp. cmx-11-12]|uniref:class E sortase n=1 Tax=Amycolatopsis sp. cmx-11-12 TaxID=2785795 RepID=UPI003917F185